MSNQWVKSGSTTASAATAHLLFGLYNGLSLLDQAATVSVSVMAQTNNAEILPDATLEPGFAISVSQIQYQGLPVMTVANARNLHFRNLVGASNSTVRWFVARRIPGA